MGREGGGARRTGVSLQSATPAPAMLRRERHPAPARQSWGWERGCPALTSLRPLLRLLLCSPGVGGPSRRPEPSPCWPPCCGLGLTARVAARRRHGLCPTCPATTTPTRGWVDNTMQMDHTWCLLDANQGVGCRLMCYSSMPAPASTSQRGDPAAPTIRASCLQAGWKTNQFAVPRAADRDGEGGGDSSAGGDDEGALAGLGLGEASTAAAAAAAAAGQQQQQRWQ